MYQPRTIVPAEPAPLLCHCCSANIVPVNARTIATFPLLDLPAELVLCVFDVLAKKGDWCTLTCLALSSRLLYHTLKERYHPTPIPLEHNFWRSDGAASAYLHGCSLFQCRRINNGSVTLAQLIKSFIGPSCRLLDGEFPPVFVSKKVYGDQDGCDNKIERELRGRRRDFRRMTHYHKGKVSSVIVCSTIGLYTPSNVVQMTHLLPSPFNKGEDWTEEVWERCLEFEKLGWTKDMEGYFGRNIRACNVGKTLARRMGYNATRRQASGGIRKGAETL
ncbi:uncharacterized protein K444DRAFT_392163 [Hyaloscypha bicolor E]|uniref:F-box domain-containing protein n=1 Tax=Hyaloscypha bicolor E TaxID=1095630 RepID=A0A2J6TBR5_9HELO|nr:uncharacterized protein K444DRAFT_392163 [Hyaloscypha bicolor E]PMD60402.1 hypothetical protein K444DRAFT_392163 [Hyaloscypha bicolor E]